MGLKLVGDSEWPIRDVYLGAVDVSRGENPVTHLFLTSDDKNRYLGSHFSDWNSSTRPYLKMNGFQKTAQVLNQGERISPQRVSYSPSGKLTKEDISILRSGQELPTARGLTSSEINEIRFHQGLPELKLAA